MANQFGIPEIEPAELADKRAEGGSFRIVDVRELNELAMANFEEGDDLVHMPLSELAQRYEDAIPEAIHDKHAELIIFCHHGGRSAQVCAYLKSQGWTNVLNLRGGIHAYALEVDSSVGVY